jgi:hypothetical protein
MPFSPTKADIAWLLALCALPVLAWTGALDALSGQYLDGSLKSAGLVYATARGINALVSLLQGTELDLVLVTFSVGEVLDPINDLIERFSTVVLFAIGSLALQHILLVAVSHNIFNAVLSAIALLAGGAMVLGKRELFFPLLKLFLIAVFVRFALGIVVLANYWVDATFLDADDARRHDAMIAFQGELRDARDLTVNRASHLESLDELQAQIAQLTQALARDEAEVAELKVSIATVRDELARLQQQSDWLCQKSAISPTCPQAVREAQGRLNALKADKALVLERARQTIDQMREAREAIVCVDKRLRGEDCSFWDKLPAPPNAAQIRQQIDGLESRVGDFADNAIQLLTSIFLKSILIPLLFIYVLIRIMRYIWRNPVPGSP